MSNVPLADRIAQYGLTEVTSPDDPLVDVVFVHGLNGHPYNTWATSKPSTYWPSDLLPSALQDQRCRILTYGYDANVTAFTDGTSKDRIHNHAEHLASRLVANRSVSLTRWMWNRKLWALACCASRIRLVIPHGVTLALHCFTAACSSMTLLEVTLANIIQLKKALDRPIIFVCHSLGGLVVKRCLIHSKASRHSHTERTRSIYVSTYGVLFLGTPHNGSDLAKWGTLLERISSAVLPKKFFDSSDQLVQALKTNNETLQNINRLFIEIIGRFHIYFFHESKPMDLKGTRGFVVDEDSAAPVIEGVERMGIERDHSHMCKFESEGAPGYDVVAEAIMRYADDAPKLIQARWDEERRIRDFEKQEAAKEILRGRKTPLPAARV